MIIKSPILLFMGFFFSALFLQAEIKVEPFKDELPSHQTQKELTSITETSPNLRFAPDEDGWAQKEVPFGDVDISTIFLLIGIAIVYCLRKRIVKRNLYISRGLRLLMVFTSTFLVTQQVSAQAIYQANHDNAFVAPNSTDFVSIDILANDYFTDECKKSEVVVSLWNGTSFVPGATGAMGENSLGVARFRDGLLSYRPLPLTSGADKIKYRIECVDKATGTVKESSQAMVYINVNDKPDAISDADCYVDPIGISFEMKELARSPLENVWTIGTPLVGDVDNDGNVEIFVLSSVTYPATGGVDQIIRAFRFNKATNSLIAYPNYNINLPRKNSLSTTFGGHNEMASAPFAIAKVDGNEKASIFAVRNNLLLRYDINVSGQYVETGRVTIAGGNRYYVGASPVVVDIMGSGRTQVCVFDEVYDTKSLRLIAKGGFLNTTGLYWGYSFGCFGAGAFSGDVYTMWESALIPGDIDGDGILELVGGDSVYKVHLDDFDSKAATNTFTLFKRADKTGHPNIGDGGTALVDIDLDGQLEVAVVGPFGGIHWTANQCIAYVYNPRTGKVMHSNNPTFPRPKLVQGPSRIFAGDIDGDGFPEICFTTYNLMVALQMDDDAGNKTTTLNTKWTYVINDESSSTTLSMFDFTQDGKARLVYRDQTHLRIIDGSGSTAIQEPGSVGGIGSLTANEFPVVADVNGDGAAEIITTGKVGGTYLEYGALRIFGADRSKGKPWAPARSVWNQTSYNPLYVNDDLTIPSKPINPSTAFISPNGDIHRPFNNFLQQSTALNKEGTMIMLGPDMTFNPLVPKRLKFEIGDKLNVSVGVINQGNAAFVGNIILKLYAYTEATSTYVEIGTHTSPNSTGLSHEAPNNTKTISFDIPAISGKLPSAYDKLIMTVNLKAPKAGPSGALEFEKDAECFEGRNNYASGFSLVDGSRVICEGNTETVNLEAAGGYGKILWYNTATGGSSIHQGTSHTVTKDNAIVNHLFVECYRTASDPLPITSVRDTIFVYLAPDTLVWTGDGNSADWHNWQNWEDPNDIYPKQACVPRACTNVEIQVGKAVYPSLENNASSTDYSKYVNAACNNIHFPHGGEVMRPDMLTYSKAFVDVTFNSHRWYMFAPPLKDFYTGDFYIEPGKAPIDDKIKSYTKYWARKNPLNEYPWGTSYFSGWTKLFNNPDEKFVAGQGLAVWISDNSVSGPVGGVNPHDPFDFEYPKNESSYTIYKENTNIPVEVKPTPRTDQYRSIFDGLAAAGSDFDLTINADNALLMDAAMIANPFMAHLDFDKFYAKNSANIQNYYKVLDENGAELVYRVGLGGTLSKDIPPMQAFFVDVKTPFSKLKANGNMTSSVPGDKLKSAKAQATPFGLTLTAIMEGYSHKAFIEFSENADDRYKADEDIPGAYPVSPDLGNKSAMIYSRTSDGVGVLVNNLNIGSLEKKEIPLGIWVPKGKDSKSLTINVSNLNLLPAGHYVYLYDKEADSTYDLSLNSMITVETVTPNNTDDSFRFFVDGRFFLRFTNETSTIEEADNEDHLQVSLNEGVLKVNTAENMLQVQLIDIQGRIILNKEPKTDIFDALLPEKGIYILRIKTAGKILVRKLLNN